MGIDKEALRRHRVDRSKALTITIPDVGEFSYRGLTREEAHTLEKTKGTLAEQEAKVFAICVLDPRWSEAEWLEETTELPAGLLEPLTMAITEASGTDAQAAKQAYLRFRAGA